MSFVNSGAYPIRSGNSVQPLVDGVPAFRRICEAIEQAQHSVWATITFMWPTFTMPDQHGTALQVFARAAARGVDVRLVFWRPHEAMEKHRRNAFWGSTDHRRLLAESAPTVNIRWDRGAPGYCQHQKTWLIDAGHDSATSFVGGINLNPNSLVEPGHAGRSEQNHDVYVELRGPSVADVQHNFVQRWNEASERDQADGVWGDRAAENLSFPQRLPARRGSARVQIQRTIHPGQYTSQPRPYGVRENFDISNGELTNLDQYCSAIRSASQAIYIENQYVEVTPILQALIEALNRGVEVLMVLPIMPDLRNPRVITAERREFLRLRRQLADYENFTLAGLAAMDDQGMRQAVYVHSKLMLVDDTFATVGSCNLHHHSLYGNAELNAAIVDRTSVTSLRVALYAEHAGVDTTADNALQALIAMKQAAYDNRQRRQQHNDEWQGLLISLDPAGYGAVNTF